MITKTAPAIPGFSQPAILLRTKMIVPAPHGRLIKRERLLKTLDTGAGGKLILLNAPAGAGKTTLLSEWISSGNLPAAWLTLDRGDNDPLRFFIYLLNALDTLPHTNAGEFAALLSNLVTDSFEPLLGNLLNRLAEHNNPAILVLDDFHTIHSRVIHESLAFLLEYLPANLHIVIATREEPPLQLGRLRAGGNLTELRGYDLQFTVDEITEFFHGMFHNDLPEKIISGIDASTEGWAAGLQMVLLAAGQNPANIPLAISGRQTHVMEYLTEEVLAHQPERVRSFLVQSSLFERISSDLCQAVFHDSIFPVGEPRETSTHAMLEYCEKANLFLLPVSSEPGWYRYQKFFLELLRAHLDEIPANRLRILYNRAAEFCESKAAYSEAVHYALAAGDVELGAEIIERNLDAILMRSEFADLLQLVAAFPEGCLEEKPPLAICRAWAISFSAAKEDAEGLLGAAEKKMGCQMDPGLIVQLEGYMAAIRARLAEIAGEKMTAVHYSCLALEKIPTGSALRPVISFFLGESAFYAGSLKDAWKYLRETAADGQKTGNLPIAVSALCRLAKVSKLEGRLKQAQDLYQEATRLVIEGGPRKLPFQAGMVEIGLADLYREWNLLDEARQALTAITVRESSVNNPNVLVFGLLTAAGLESIDGNAESATVWLRKAQKISERHHLFFDIRSQLEGQWLQFWAAAGDEGLIESWISEMELDEDKPAVSLAACLDQLNLARAAISVSRVEQAREILESLAGKGVMNGLAGVQIEISLLQALVRQAQGKSSMAIELLKNALDLGEKQGHQRIFLDKGHPLAALLRLGIKRDRWTPDSFAGRLLKTMEECRTDGQTNRRKMVGRKIPELVEPLTAREVEILRFMADGYSNAEIASQLVLSVGTIKAHLHHVFGKLGVDGRVMAIQRGKELNLI